jgi:hypothetical protein
MHLLGHVRLTRRRGRFGHAGDDRRDGNNMLTRYVRHPTDNKSSGPQPIIAKGWLHYILEKSTPLLLCKGSDDAADGKQRERRFAFCVRWIGQRNRGAIFPATKGQEGVTRWFRFGGFWWHSSEADAGACCSCH